MSELHKGDPEKGWSSPSQAEIGSTEVVSLDDYSEEGGWARRWINSWKPVEIIPVDPTLTREQRSIAATADVPLKRKLKSRHLQMIGIGGAIGAGLFISTGSALKNAGPAGLLLAYFFVGILIFCTMNTLGELGVRYVVNGAFSAYNCRFVDHSWGFAIGWVYAIGWLITMPNELIAAAVTLKFWEGDHNGATEVNRAAWIALFLGVIFFINVFGVRGYGEAEFIFSFIKVIAVIGFIIVGIVITCGGAPNHEYLGGKYWHNPGAFANGAKGVCKVFVSAAYAFSGTELAGLAAAETQNPKKAVPKACKQVFWRILIFYLVSVIIIGCLVPYTDNQLGTASNASASPFVIAIHRARIKALPSILNTVIIIAVFSVGNAAVFASSRTLVALAAQGHAPQFLMWIDREGRPVAAMMIALAFGFLAFISAWDGYGVVFDWLSALGGMGGVWNWGSINLCHIRNRMAMKRHGLDTRDLDFAVPGGYVVPTVGVLLASAVICLQFWTSLFPLHWTDPGVVHNASKQVESFFETWLSTALLLVFFIGHKIWTRHWWYVRLDEIDIQTGVRNKDPEALRSEIAEDKARLALRPWYIRTYRFWC